MHAHTNAHQIYINMCMHAHACTLHSYTYINSDTYTPQEIYIHAQKHTHILNYTHTLVIAIRVPPQF